MTDNALADLPPLALFSGLRRLDLSYNSLRDASGVSALAGNGSPLSELYLTSNKLRSSAPVRGLLALEVLELGSNRLRAVEGLEGMSRLRDLWLGRNKIASLAGGALPPALGGALTRLSVQSNRLTRIEGLDALGQLQELYLSHNGISVMEGLGELRELRVLDLSANAIPRIQGLEGCPKLTDLWFSSNKVESLDGLGEALGAQRETVTTIYLEGNPAAKDDPEYRAKVLAALPRLEQLDANPVVRR